MNTITDEEVLSYYKDLSAFTSRFKPKNVKKDLTLQLARLFQDLSNHIRSCYQDDVYEHSLASPQIQLAGGTDKHLLWPNSLDVDQTLPMVTDTETTHTYSGLPAVSDQIAHKIPKVLTSMDSRLNRLAGNYKHGLQNVDKRPTSLPKLAHDETVLVHDDILAHEERKMAHSETKLAPAKTAMAHSEAEKLAQEKMARETEKLAREAKKLAQEKMARETEKLAHVAKLGLDARNISQAQSIKPKRPPKANFAFECSSEEDKLFYSDVKDLLKSEMSGLGTIKQQIDFMLFTALDRIYCHCSSSTAKCDHSPPDDTKRWVKEWKEAKNQSEIQQQVEYLL